MEKFKLFIAKYRLIIYIIVFCGLAFAFWLFIHEYWVVIHNISETTKGIIGTLLGAIVGGAFSLFGSFFATKNSQKAINAIRRKNEIYKPLYNELVEIHDEILIHQPYPHIIAFESGPQTELKHPQYIEWGKIRKDVRYFEVPDKLKNAMNCLYNSIDLYRSSLSKAESALGEIYRIERSNISSFKSDNLGNIGFSLIPYILSGKRPSDNILIWNSKDFDTKKIDDFWDCLLISANSNIEIIKCRDAKLSWCKAEESVIDLLGTFIQYINIMYEK